MKEIARGCHSHAQKEQANYLDAPENSSDSRGGQETLRSTGRQSKRRQIDGQDGASELVEGSSPELEQKSSVSVYENPLWSKCMTLKTNSCGGPLSVRMVARLDDTEVPVDYEIGDKIQYTSVDKPGNTGIRDQYPGSEERYTSCRLEETAGPLKNLRPSADDSSSSSCNPGGSQNMQIQALSRDQNYDSSSSDSGSKSLHWRHRREVSKDESLRRCTREQNFEAEDSDSTNRSSSSDDSCTDPHPFVGDAEDHLARLTLAKVQTRRLSQESLARVNTIYKRLPSETSEKTGSDPWITEGYEVEPELPKGRHGKLVMREKSRSMVATTLPPKKLTAREMREFHLLERRVQREFGASRRNTELENCQYQEGISKTSSAADYNGKADKISNICQHHFKSDHDPSLFKEAAGNDTECGMTRSISPPTEQLNGPVSSVVKLFFGAPEEPRTDEGRTAEDPSAYNMIRRKVELLDAEILNFTKENKKIKILVKEQNEHADRLKREKAAWEQQKASDEEALQIIKDTEMSKLQKERTKLEQQARVEISKHSRKQERTALDELKATLARELAAHSKKEEQWRLTSNRLRKANMVLVEQIYELRKEIRRLEEQIFLELDARGCPSDASAKSSRKLARGRTDSRTSNQDSLIT